MSSVLHEFNSSLDSTDCTATMDQFLKLVTRGKWIRSFESLVKNNISQQTATLLKKGRRSRLFDNAFRSVFDIVVDYMKSIICNSYFPDNQHSLSLSRWALYSLRDTFLASNLLNFKISNPRTIKFEYELYESCCSDKTCGGHGWVTNTSSYKIADATFTVTDPVIRSLVSALAVLYWRRDVLSRLNRLPLDVVWLLITYL